MPSTHIQGQKSSYKELLGKYGLVCIHQRNIQENVSYFFQQRERGVGKSSQTLVKIFSEMSFVTS